MSDLITTLHPQGDNSVNLYPNVKLENIIDGTAEDAGKFVKVNEEGKFIVDTVNIPEPQQVNNSTVTIKQGGVDKGSFTLNQAEDATIELDAGGAGESGSSMYATSSAISKSVPAHIEAANPIQVGDTISQLYFNTQQDISDYLANVVDWGSEEKVRFSMDMLSYPLLSVTPPSGTVGTKIEVGSYIEGITTPTEVHIGDKNPALDDILKSMSIENSDGSKVLLQGLFNRNNDPVDILRVYKNFDTQVVSLQYKNSSDIWSDLYTTAQGYATNQNTISSASSNTIAYFSLANLDKSNLNPLEVIITSIDPSFEALNGDIFGAYSITGKPILTAISAPENPDYYRPKTIYMLISNLADAVNAQAQDSDLPFYYISTETIIGDGIMSGGWKISPDFTLALSSPEVAYKLQPCVSSIASTENNWVEVPEVYGNIYKENILGTDDIKVDDILVDTKGKFGKVKEIAEVSFKNQHAENRFVVGEEITADSALYIDPTISVDFSKFDWDNAEQWELGPAITFISTSNSHELGFVVKISPIYMQLMGGISVDNDIYMVIIGVGKSDLDFDPSYNYVIYIGIDPDDAEKIIGSYVAEIFIPEAFNKFAVNGNIEKEGDLYKISLSDDAGSSIGSINDQDAWTSFISKDGRWIEDEPTIKTEIRCDVLANLPKSYNQLTDIPIIKVNSMDVSYELIPASYANKYVQDRVGFIYFCDGERFYKLTGNSSSGFTINITARDGLRTYNTISAGTNYSTEIRLTDERLSNASEGDYSVLAKQEGSYGWVLPRAKTIVANNGINASREVIGVSDITTIGLETTNLGQYSQASGDQVFGKRGNSFGWVSVPSQSGTSIQAGSGIEVIGNTVNLTSRYVNKEINSTNTDMFVMARGGSSMSDPIGWGRVIIPHGITAGTGLVEESTNPSDQTKIGLSSSDLNYSHTLTKVYSKNTSSNTFGWVSLDDYARTCHAGTGISIERSSTSDTISLSQEVQGKLARIPDLPSADGNYALTCTISGGVPTFAWTLAT